MPANVSKKILESTIDNLIETTKDLGEPYTIDVAVVDGCVIQMNVMTLEEWNKVNGVGNARFIPQTQGIKQK